MFPHPGTRIAHPTNGRLPPSGRVLEASANEQAQKRVAGRALRSSTRYWDVGKEGGEGRDGNRGKEGHGGGRKKRSELRCGNEDSLRLWSRVWEEALSGFGEEHAVAPPGGLAGFWRLREVAFGSKAPSFLFPTPHTPARRRRRPAGIHPSSGAPSSPPYYHPSLRFDRQR